ncbi:hypothetical protein [Imtechella halotolerans]|nr:hypothetical protein [Imtechella halotolerans]WMQ63160.1 hypothetical protein PT603_12575 [Imtechella halotolerans]
MRNYVFLILLFLFSSCEWMPGSVPTQEAMVAKQLAAIDMNEVEKYPLFDHCDETASRITQKKCFEETLSRLFWEAFQSESFLVKEPISDTIYAYFIVTNEGKIVYDKMESNAYINTYFPSLDSLLKVKSEVFPVIHPALKQGIKVASKCKLPIVISSE